MTARNVTVMFAACTKFGPWCGDKWWRYLDWLGCHHVSEIVSADSILCPSPIDTLNEVDWNYNVHADTRTHFFRDVDYLKRRIDFDPQHHHILALFDDPQSVPILPEYFAFCGYDILDSYDAISVLLNCGGFPDIFDCHDINEFGLIASLDRARDIACALRRDFSADPHCHQCRVWGVARYKGDR